MTSIQNVEMRAVIKFCEDLGHTPTQTHQLIQQSHRNCSRELVLKWHRRFRQGRTSVEDDDRSGRPASVRPRMVERVKECIINDRRLTLRGIADDLGTSYGTVERILTQDLNMTKVSAMWVPRLLSCDDKEKRVACSTEFLRRYDREGEAFLDRIITQDETWLHHFDPESKRQSAVWKTPRTPPPKKSKRIRSSGKHMFVFFMDRRGMILIHQVPDGRTVNAAYYCKEWQVSTPYHLQMYEAFGWLPPLYAHLPLILNTDGLKLSKRNKDNSVEYLREWQVSTPYHLQMYEAFGWQPPLYAHLPLILNTDGLKLSKRNKDNSVEYLREIGYTPEAVLNYITTVSGGLTRSTAGATLPEMVATFSLDRVARNHARLQPEKLATVSRSHIQRQLRGDDRAGLVDRTRQLVRQTFADRLTDTDDQNRLLSDDYIESVLCWGAEQRISRIDELTSKQLQFVWVCLSDKDIHCTINPSLDFVRVLSDVRDRLGLVEEYIEEGLKEELTCYSAESGLGMKVYMALLRTVLGGDKVGPPVAEMMSIIGKAETLRRLDHALSVLRPTETRDVVR